jgi:hypothetical protein
MIRALMFCAWSLWLALMPSWAAASLVAEYRFEESSYNGTAGEVADSSGNGNHGSMVRSSTSLAYPSSTPSGKICRGLSIPQNSDASIQAFNTGIDVNTLGQTGSITFWYKGTGTGSTAHRALVDATMSSTSKFLLWRDDKDTGVDLYHYISDSGGSQRDDHEVNVIEDDVWAHIAITWTATANRMKIYVNGTLEGSDTDSFSGSALNTAIGTLYIGDNRSAASDELLSANGLIDQVRIYNHEMSAAEITTDKNTTPVCTTLHHMEVSTLSSSAAPGAAVAFTIKACANAACSTLYTGGVTGNLSITGVTPTYTTGASYSIAAGSSSTTETASMTAGSATVTLTSVSPTPSNSPALFCGLGVAAATGNSCALTVSSGPDHLEITTTSSNGLTCAPASFTIKACANSSSPCTSAYVGGVTGNLVLTGTGGSTAAFTIDATGTTTVSRQITKVGSVTTGVSSVSPAASGSPALTCGIGGATPSSAGCSTAYTTASSLLSFSVPNHVSDVSQSVTITALKSSSDLTACVPAFTGAKSVTFTCQHVNPNSGTKSVLVGGNATTCGGSGQSMSLSFNASGAASTSVQYPDVGQVTLTGTYAGAAGVDSDVTGGSTFIAAPASFTISGVTTGNITAGSAFSATITARNNSGAATPNFGRESPAISDYVRLAWTKAMPTGTAAVSGTLTGTGTSGTPSLASGSFSNGAATVNDLAWSEVGTGDLGASLVGSTYLGVSSTVVTGSTGSSGAIGPFLPHHLTVSTNHSCSSNFTYSGQPFAVTVKAYNAANAITANYDGSLNTSPRYAKAVTLSATSNGGSGSLSNATMAASSFAAGTATITASSTSPSFTLTNKQTAPTAVGLRAIDSDAISSSGYAEGSVSLRSGQLKFSNAFGSEKASLLIPVQAQYWSGRAWVLNALDSCTSVPVAAIGRSNYLDHKGAATAAWTTTASAVTISGGIGWMTLSAPSPTASGSVDIAVNLGASSADNACTSSHASTTGAQLSWLRSLNGHCSASPDRDPFARITFGIYSPETRKTVHVREHF